MDDKDFLNSLAKPASFKEEERIPVKKKKRKIRWGIIIPISLLSVACVGGGVFFFTRPTIEVPNFVGKTQKEVAQWVTQQGIEKTGIIFNQEFSLEYDDGQIISQNIEAGKKVKKDVKLDFVMSKGADPDEKIEVPDIKNMTKDELEKWSKDNKLIKTKIMTSFSEEIEKDKVISYEFKGCEEDEFIRGCSLNISVSKGEAPKKQVKMENFIKKSFAEVETWAKTNKIKLEKVESYSNNIESGMIISQSIEAGKQIKEDETLTVYVSKGKGVKVPNFNKMSNSDIDDWIEENASSVSVDKIYSNKSGYVVSQNYKAGEYVGGEDKLKLTLNMGNTFYLSDLELDANNLVGMKYDKLVDWCNNHRHMGIEAYTGQWGENTEAYSETHSKGTIISIECHNGETGEIYSCDSRLPLNVRFSVVVSKGKVFDLSLKEVKDENGFITSKLVDLFATKNITFVNTTSNERSSLYINDKEITEDNIRIYEGDNIVIKPSNQ